MLLRLDDDREGDRKTTLPSVSAIADFSESEVLPLPIRLRTLSKPDEMESRLFPWALASRTRAGVSGSASRKPSVVSESPPAPIVSTSVSCAVSSTVFPVTIGGGPATANEERDSKDEIDPLLNVGPRTRTGGS